MATMNISLPDAMKSFIEDQAARQGFATVSEYVRALIREAQERQSERDRVESLLLDGIASGAATPLTGADWREIRREVHRRQAEREGTSHGSKATECQ